ncbi:MAG: glutaminyl-peptide cyclotransferase [Acidimicrobiales bacterium]
MKATSAKLLALTVTSVAIGLTVVALDAFGGDSQTTSTEPTSAASTSESPTSEASTTTGSATTSTTTSSAATSTSEPTSDSTTATDVDGPAPLLGRYTVEIVAQYPSDVDAYVQGLELLPDGRVLRSDGRYGESDRNVVDLESGAVLLSFDLADDRFGEGATLVGDEIHQLTWKAGTVEVSSLDTLSPVRSLDYEGEGWGLCWNGAELAMSDGSATIDFRDPESFDVVRSVTVIDASGAEVSGLNELECVGEQVLANRYGADDIVVIDAATGAVDAVIDASGVRPPGLPPDGANPFDYVLNGIAWDASDDTYLLTGKWWPTISRVRLIDD